MRWMLLPLKRYADFSGRSRRREYWLFFLGAIVLYVALITLAAVLLGGAAIGAMDADAGSVTAMFGQGFLAIGVILAIILVWWALLIPSLAVGVRRLHDVDRSGWWLMIGYGPWLAGEILASVLRPEWLVGLIHAGALVGFIVLLVFAVRPGTSGPNRFGPDPKGVDLGQVFA